MARFRKIDPRIWNDAKFGAFSDNGKLAFLMLLTHPNMTSLGAMRATLGGLAEELGWTAEAFREAFREAQSKGMVEHDPKACLIAVPNFIKYNAPESPNVVKAWIGALDLLPECALKARVVARAKAFAEGMGKGFLEAFAESFAKTMPNKEPEPEPEKKNTPNPPRSSAGADSLSDGFTAFWSAYPAKKARAVAAKAWAKLKPDQQMQAAIMAGVERDKASEQWMRDGGRFIPHPATWLNQRRWEDEAPAHGASTSNSPAWWERAGFATEGDAADAGCWQSNWREFQDGQRVAEVPA